MFLLLQQPAVFCDATCSGSDFPHANCHVFTISKWFFMTRANTFFSIKLQQCKNVYFFKFSKSAALKTHAENSPFYCLQYFIIACPVLNSVIDKLWTSSFVLANKAKNSVFLHKPQKPAVLSLNSKKKKTLQYNFPSSKVFELYFHTCPGALLR